MKALDADIYGNIMALEVSLQERIRNYLRERGIDTTTYQCLEYIAGHGGCFASEIARNMQEDRAVVNRRLSRLGERGYIRKKTSKQDCRARALSTTPAGRAIVNGVEAIAENWNKEIRSSIGEEDYLAFASVVRKMSSAVRPAGNPREF